jgi:hypothetical protein
MAHRASAYRGHADEPGFNLLFTGVSSDEMAAGESRMAVHVAR